MGWSNGTEVIQGIAEAVNLCNLQSNESVFWSLIVDRLEALDWDERSEAYGLNPDLDRVLALRDITAYYDGYDYWGAEEVDKRLEELSQYLSEEDVELLNSIRQTI